MNTCEYSSGNFSENSLSNRLQSQHVDRHQLRRREIQQTVSPAGHRLHFRHTLAWSLGADLPILLLRADLPNYKSMSVLSHCANREILLSPGCSTARSLRSRLDSRLSISSNTDIDIGAGSESASEHVQDHLRLISRIPSSRIAKDHDRHTAKSVRVS